LVLDKNALVLASGEGQVVIASEDLMIVGDNIKTLKLAKSMALSKKKQAFVFKGQAYIKQGSDFILAQKNSRNVRREIATIESIKEIDNLLETLEKDPYEFREVPQVEMTQLDPIIETKIEKEAQVKRDRAQVADLLDKLKQGLSL
jgi:hypothetical protein